MGQCCSSSSPAADATHSTSTVVAETATGSHVLRIDGYSRTLGHGVGKSIRSGTFVVGGHNWRILYYPDGVDALNADYIRVALFLDHPVPNNGVKAQYKLSLLDQAGKPVSQYTRTSDMTWFTTAKPNWGYHSFIYRKDLESSTYLKRDSFGIRCDVTVVKDIMIKPVTTTPVELLAVVPPLDLPRHLGDLLTSNVGGDVTFHVGGEQFTAHRYVLAARSAVFKAELLGPVHVHDMEARVFQTMLHFIYTDTLPEMDKGVEKSMAQRLLVAADRYKLERLKLICEDMLCGYIDVNIAATTLVLAEQHGYSGLKEACFRFIKSPGNLKAVMASDGLQHLKDSCPSLLEELLAMVAP